MRKFIKWAAITIGCFILILATVVWVLVGKTNKRMARIYDVYPGEIVTLSWEFEQFEHVMRKGIRPDGRQLSEYMPYKATAQMSDQDMQSVYTYLKSLEGTQTAMK